MAGVRDRNALRQVRLRLARIKADNSGDLRGLGDGLAEVRIFTGAGYRLYCTQEGTHILVLLCGGSKGSQRRDIALARTYLRDYLRRRDGTD